MMLCKNLLFGVRLVFLKLPKSRLSTLPKGKDFKNNSLSDFYGKRKDIRDHNFNYFRGLDDYRMTVVPKWTNDILKNSISEFSSNHSVGDPKSEKILSFLAGEKVMNLQDSDMKLVMSIIANMYFNSWRCNVPTKWLDIKCATTSNTLSLDSNLFIFDCWFVFCGHKVFQTQYFRSLLNIWGRDMNSCTKNQAVQMLYYLGLSKRAPESILSGLIMRFEEYAYGMSSIEWAIVCLSFFKTSKKIESEILLKKSVETAKLLIEENNLFHSISVIKLLRQAQHYDESLTLLLKDFVMDKCSTFQFVECTHFLAAFSSESVYDKDVITCLEHQAVRRLQEELQDNKQHDDHAHPSEQSRSKDLARFLWGLATVGHEPSKVTIDTVLQMISIKNQADDFEKNPNALVDCMHSLAMMNVYHRPSFSMLFNENILANTWEIKKAKPKYQLFFIVQSMQIESNIWQHMFSTKHSIIQRLKPLPKDIYQQIDSRQELQKVKELLGLSNIPPSSIEYCYMLPHIAIAGIFVRKHDRKNINNPSGICIEVLDDKVCCRDSTKPLGLMKTKLRQLKQLPYKLCVISPKDIDDIMKLTPDMQKERVDLWLL